MSGKFKSENSSPHNWEDIACHGCNQTFPKLKSEIRRRQEGGFFHYYCSNKCKFTKVAETRNEKKGYFSFQESDLARFWSSVDKTLGYGPNGDCWIWIGVIGSRGYGQFWHDKSKDSSHHYSYKLHKGEIPKGMLIRHSCHNPPCCNPDHLETGTSIDNSQDMVKAGRQQKGSARKAAKITEETALKIKDLLDQGYKPTAISQKLQHLGVTRSIAENISGGWGWQHLWGRVNRVRSKQRKDGSRD